MTVEIPLTKGYTAIVDDADGDLVGDPFAAPRYWVRSRRHQGNSRRERED